MKTKPKEGMQKDNSLEKQCTCMTCEYLQHLVSYKYLHVSLPVKFPSFLLPVLIPK